MIRLQRVGRKNIPAFRVVLTDSKNSTKSGKYLEVLGNFEPVNDVKTVDGERIKHWISKGAKLSDTMHNFLIDQKVITGKKINALPKKTPIKPAQTEVSGKDEPATEAKPAEAQKAKESPKEEVKADLPAATSLTASNTQEGAAQAGAKPVQA